MMDKTTSGRPNLIVHAGFAKCATTSMQYLLRRNDFELVRALGHVWLGQDFKPFNGLSPVIKIGYQTSAAIEDIMKNEFASNEKYMLSAESLLGKRRVFEALSERFEIKCVVMTIRFPPLITLSEFCFRGWLDCSLESYLASPQAGPQTSLQRHRRMLDTLAQHAGINPRLCPVEADELPARFLMACFGEAPTVTKLHGDVEFNKNKSPSPSLAMILSEIIRDFGAVELSRDVRRKIIRAAQGMEIDQELKAFTPCLLKQAISTEVLTEQHFSEYEAMLLEHGSDTVTAEASQIKARHRIDSILCRPSPPASLLDKARAEARSILKNFVQ